MWIRIANRKSKVKKRKEKKRKEDEKREEVNASKCECE